MRNQKTVHGNVPVSLVEGLYQIVEEHRGACLPPDDRALLAFAAT